MKALSFGVCHCSSSFLACFHFKLYPRLDVNPKCKVSLYINASINAFRPLQANVGATKPTWGSLILILRSLKKVLIYLLDISFGRSTTIRTSNNQQNTWYSTNKKYKQQQNKRTKKKPSPSSPLSSQQFSDKPCSKRSREWCQ